MPDSEDLGNLNTKNWDDLQRLADALEASWKKGQPTDLVELLPPPGTPIRAIILRELIKTDLECRWRHGQGATLDPYLEKFAADLGPVQSLSAELVYEEYRVRQLFGDRPSLEQYRVRFPNQFPEVERLARENPPPAALEGAAPAAALASSPSATPSAAGGHASFGKNIVVSQTGGYTLLERIGTGAFAEVWKAKAPGGVLKAIKIIVRPIDQAEAQREFEAMELMKNLRHHFLLPVHAFWALEDRLIILMDLADGSLRDCLNKHRKEGKQAIPLPELMRYFRQAAEALDYLHEKKVQHRDIKPENILLTEGHVRVADFGLAKAQGTQRMATGTFAGTPLYMPPETWEDKTHIHGDQYSLAAAFFELRTGRRLYKDAGLPSLMHSHLHETPNLGPLAADEQRVLLKALSKNPEERYPDCLTFVRALEKAVAVEFPAESVELPATPGSPTASDNALHTLLPGQGTKPASWRAPANLSPDTYRDKKTLAPASPKATRSSRKVAVAAGALLVLGLVSLLVWFFLGPTPEKGDLTLLQPSVPIVRAGEHATFPVAIERDNFTQPVQLKFTSSADVLVEEGAILSGETSVRVKLKVADQAAPGPRRITMEAYGGGHCAYVAFDVTIGPRDN